MIKHVDIGHSKHRVTNQNVHNTRII